MSPVHGPSGNKPPPPPPDAMDMDDEGYGMDEMPLDQPPKNLPKGNPAQATTAEAKQALLTQALQAMNMEMGYFEGMLNGKMVWFSTAEVIYAHGTPQQKAMMGQAQIQTPSQYGGNSNSTRMAMSGPGGGGGERLFMGGPGGYGGGGYGGYGMGGYGGYGSGPLYNTMFGGIQQDEMYAQRRQIRKTEQQMRYKMRMIMFMILCGDVTGAMRAMIFESERMNRMFNRTLVKQLNRVREAKAKILKAMGSKRPPTAHSNVNNPDGAARDQNRQAKYTQWVSVTTQLMSEVQQTERELLDLLSEGRRNINELWEAYSGLKEAEGRTTRTLIQSFRG